MTTARTFTTSWYGEVGLFAALFCDLESSGLAGLGALLSACEFESPIMSGRGIIGVRTFLPAPFGFQGFGVIDALIKIDLDDRWAMKGCVGWLL